MADTETRRPALTWREHVYLRVKRKDPFFHPLDKVEVNEAARSAGLTAPRIYAIFPNATAISLKVLPDVFVLKPTTLAAKRGVMLLHRIPKTFGFWDSLHKRYLTDQQIIAEQVEWEHVAHRHNREAPKFIAEERLFGESNRPYIPIDYKVFTFLDEVKFILQINRNHGKPRVAFFFDEFLDADLADKVTCSWNKVRPDRHRVPLCAAAMIQAAKKMAVHLQTPFASFDFFATRSGPVLGEVTSTPGGPYFQDLYSFTPAYDRELGVAWIRANTRLGRPTPLIENKYKIRHSSMKHSLEQMKKHSGN